MGNVDNSFINDGSDIYRSYLFSQLNALECLNEVANKLGGYLQYRFVYDDTYDEFINYIDLVKANDYNNVEISYKKNLQYIKKEIDTTENIYTRVYPYGKDNLTINDIGTTSRTDGSTTYNDHVLGQSYIENYQYYLSLGYSIDFCRENFVNDFEMNDDSYVDEDDIFKDAKELLEKVSMPKITYRVNMIDLSIFKEYDYEKINVGDTIRVRDDELDTDINTVISDKTTNYDNPQNPSLELTNAVDNLGGFIYQLMKNNNKYTDLNKVYGKSTTYIIADKLTSKNWRYADFVVDEKNSFADILEKVLDTFTSQGGKIILLDGQYFVDRKIVIRDIENIIISGQGEGTLIKVADDADKNNIYNVLSVEFTINLILSNFSLDLNNSNVSGVITFGIDIVAGENVSLDNVNILNCDNYGVRIIDSYDTFFSNIIIKNDNLIANSKAIFTHVGSNTRFNNIVINNYDVGVEDGTTTEGQGNHYSNFSISECGKGFYLNGRGSSIVDSVIQECNIGIEIKGVDYIITGNTIKNKSDYVGSDTAGIYSNDDELTIIDNNIIDNIKGTGIWSNSSSKTIISNNIIKNCDDEGLNVTSGYSCKIINNFLYNNDINDDTSFIAINTRDSEIQSNTIRDAVNDRAISLVGCDRMLVINNDLIRGYVTTPIYQTSCHDIIVTSQNRS